MNDTSQTRTQIFRSACRVAAALLFLSLADPVLGQNYSLHSPKLWSPEEKELYDKEFKPARTELTPIQTEKAPAKKRKVQKGVQAQKVQAQKVQAQKVQAQKARDLSERILVRDGVSYREVMVQKGDTLAKISRKYRNNDPTYTDILAFNAIEPSKVLHSGDIIKLPVIVKTIKSHQAVQELKPAAPVVSNRPASVKPAAGPACQRPASPLRKPEATSKGVLAAKGILRLPAVPLPPAPAKAALQQTVVFPDITTARHLVERSVDMVGPKPSPVQAVPVCDRAVPVPVAPVCAKPETEKPQPCPGAAMSGQQLFELAVKSYRQGDCVAAVQLFARFLVENTDSLFAPDASLYNADCYLKLSSKSDIEKGNPLRNR